MTILEQEEEREGENLSSNTVSDAAADAVEGNNNNNNNNSDNNDNHYFIIVYCGKTTDSYYNWLHYAVAPYSAELKHRFKRFIVGDLTDIECIANGTQLVLEQYIDHSSSSNSSSSGSENCTCGGLCDVDSDGDESLLEWETESNPDQINIVMIYNVNFGINGGVAAESFFNCLKFMCAVSHQPAQALQQMTTTFWDRADTLHKFPHECDNFNDYHGAEIICFLESVKEDQMDERLIS